MGHPISLKNNIMFMARAAVGSGLFASLFVDADGQDIDILEGGRIACARFVSVILHSFGLMNSPHATVSGTIRDMEESGWRKVQEAKPGAVLVWVPDDHDGSVNRHIGFYLGDERAISNSTSKKVIIEHHWTYGNSPDSLPVREIESIYWHESLK